MENEAPGIKDPAVVLDPVKLNVSKVAPVHGEGGIDVAKSCSRKIVDPQIARAHTARVDQDLSTRMKNQLQMDQRMAPSPKMGG